MEKVAENNVNKIAGKESDQIISRREALAMLGAMSASGLSACGGGGGGSSATATTTTTTTTTTPTTTPGACVLIPADEEGPFPLLAILTNSTITRQNITEGKPGIPLTLILNLQNVNRSCAALTNAAVYIWQCDRDGAYSGYTNQNGASTVGQTYLRGIQVSDSNGKVTFNTIYPGWYPGRVTHIHLKIYLNNAVGGTSSVTSQMAFPAAITTAVYNSAAYPKGQNTSVTSNETDSVFRDGTTYQMLTLTGDNTNGYSATLTVGVAA